MDYADIAIVGGGIAGIFAAYRIALEHKEAKTIVFDIGRPHGKRRAQMYGFFGLFPNSDGKLYLNDIETLATLTGKRKTLSTYKWLQNHIPDDIDYSVSKDNTPNISTEKRIAKLNFKLQLNDLVQLYPRDIHSLSKHLYETIDASNNVSLSFDNEVYQISKQKNRFLLQSQQGDVSVKKLIVCVGRAGWRWAAALYKSLGLIAKNDSARFGIRVEIPAQYLKDFNHSNCSLSSDETEIGPLCWDGTMVPEDHVDFTTSSFRSNEDRWKSDKVSFNLTNKVFFNGNGFEQLDRISQLTFILANDRIVRERISTLINNRSRISIMPEYKWLKNSIEKADAIIPSIISKGSFYVPTVCPLVPNIHLNKNLMTDMTGMYCAGESAGHYGILFAALSGLVAADAIFK